MFLTNFVTKRTPYKLLYVEVYTQH